MVCHLLFCCIYSMLLWLLGSFAGNFKFVSNFVVKNSENSNKRNRESKAGTYGFDRKGKLIMNENSAIGSSWDEVRADLFTSEEIAESDLRVALIGELIKARQEKGISQKKHFNI